MEMSCERKFGRLKRRTGTGILLCVALLCLLVAYPSSGTAKDRASEGRAHFYPADFFQDAVVQIQVDYEAGEILVDKEMIMIYFDPLNKDPRKARQLRWIVEGLAESDLLMIRPKSHSSKAVFSPGTQGVFAIPGRFNSVASGLPQNPDFDASGSAMWEYDIEIWRDGELLLFKDPAIWIENDG